MIFAQPPKSERKRWSRSLLASVLAHLFALLVLLHRPDAIFVRPSSVARGDGLRTTRVVYSGQAAEESTPPPDVPHLSLNALSQPVRHLRAPKPAKERQISREGDIADKSARAGTPFGSLLEGPLEGHDIRPAFPVVFPDPPILHGLPADVQGDVVVEVTIDDHGNVIETRVLQSLGHGIDEKVVATLQTWRFKPAMMDGRPIASKHDVHFHLPS